MGCWGSDGHREDKSRILGTSLFLVAVNDVLIRFCDEGKENEEFRIRVRSAAEFITILGADFSKELRKCHDRLNLTKRLHYGFRGEERLSQIRYVHHDVFRRFIEGHKYQGRMLEVVKKLRSVLDRRLTLETRKANADFCIHFLADFNGVCLHQFRFYEPRIPQGIRKLCATGQL